MSVRDVAADTAGCLLILSYLLIGLVQFVAIVLACETWFEVHALIAIVPAFIVAYIPVVGPVVGVMGAMEAWGWPMPLAIGLFALPYLIGVLRYSGYKVFGNDPD
jgi:hypothetical protein